MQHLCWLVLAACITPLHALALTAAGGQRLALRPSSRSPALAMGAVRQVTTEEFEAGLQDCATPNADNSSDNSPAATRSEAGSSSKANGPLLKKGGKGKEEPLKKRASWFSLKRLMPSSSSQEKYASAAVDATPPSKSNKRYRSFSLRKPSFGGSMRGIGRSFSFMPTKSARRQSRDNLAARTAFHESKAERKRRDSESTPSAPASARQESEESVEFGV